MKKKNIVFVTSNCDWEGLYINGKLVMENHMLDLRDVLKRLDIKCDFIEADDEWLFEHGVLPKNLSDVKSI